MLAPHLCGGARIIAMNSVDIVIAPSHKRGLEISKKRQEVPVVLPDRRSAVIRPDGAGRERPGLGGEVDLSIDIGRFDGDMAEPRADGVDVDARAEQVRGSRVPQRILTLLMNRP